MLERAARGNRTLAALLKDHAQAFSPTLHPFRHANCPPLHIRRQGNLLPDWRPQYRMPPVSAKTASTEIQNLLQLGIVQPATSTRFNNPIVMVAKPNGGIRMCVDLTATNVITIPDLFPLPTVQDTLHNLARSDTFSSFDCTSFFFQLPLHQADRPLTAFTDPSSKERFQFTRAVMGFTNSSPHAQRFTTDLLYPMRHQVTGFVDDYHVATMGADENIRACIALWRRCIDFRVLLHPGKMQLLQSTINSLGHKVSHQSIQVTPDKVAAIVDWPTPTTKKNGPILSGLGHFPPTPCPTLRGSCCPTIRRPT